MIEQIAMTTHLYRNRMNAFTRSLMLTAVLLGGCRATHDVAVSSYHVTRGVAVGSYRVATAPVHYAFRRHGSESSAGAATETTSSDVAQPGQAIPPPEVASAPRQRSPQSERESTQGSASSTAPRVTRRETARTTPSSSLPSSSSHASTPSADFPTAKSVPGKPGYVFSPFDSSGRYVDVSGYLSGSKVKDPWTDKIFIVP